LCGKWVAKEGERVRGAVCRVNPIPNPTRCRCKRRSESVPCQKSVFLLLGLRAQRTLFIKLGNLFLFPTGNVVVDRSRLTIVSPKILGRIFFSLHHKRSISCLIFQRHMSQRRLLRICNRHSTPRYGANGKDGAPRCERGRAPPPRRSRECRGLGTLLYRCVYFLIPGLIPFNASLFALPVDVSATCGSFAARGRTSAPACFGALRHAPAHSCAPAQARCCALMRQMYALVRRTGLAKQLFRPNGSRGRELTGDWSLRQVARLDTAVTTNVISRA
jgi:hypothetical protein